MMPSSKDTMRFLKACCAIGTDSQPARSSRADGKRRRRRRRPRRGRRRRPRHGRRRQDSHWSHLSHEEEASSDAAGAEDHGVADAADAEDHGVADAADAEDHGDAADHEDQPPLDCRFTDWTKQRLSEWVM